MSEVVIDMVLPDRFRARALWALAALLGGLIPAGMAVADDGHSAESLGAPGTVESVSVDSDELQLAAASSVPYVRPTSSAHGRFVVFQTYEAVAQSDVNNEQDVYVRDRVLGTTRLVSGAGGQARSGGGASISADGRYVAFVSDSSALAQDDNNGAHFDVFVRDMQTREVTLVSKATDGTQRALDVFSSPVISGDGSRVAFLTSARLSPADDDTAPADQWFNRLDAYVHNLANGTTRLVSVNARGANFTGPVGLGGMSYDGQLVGFSWGNSGRHKLDVPAGFYVRNMNLPGSKLIWREDLNLISNELDGAPALSGTGRYAAFTSKSPRLDADPDYNKYDVARYDRKTGRLLLVSVGVNSDANGDSWAATLSYSGSYLSFASEATNLVPGDDNDATDAFRCDVLARQITLVSATPHGEPGSAGSALGGAVAISGDGEHVYFISFANDLVPTDTNRKGDVFLWTALD
ncbi:MAG: TolB family protein [Nocardioidaceae bacterium]